MNKLKEIIAELNSELVAIRQNCTVSQSFLGKNMKQRIM